MFLLPSAFCLLPFALAFLPPAQARFLRAPNIMKRACVASQNRRQREARCSQYSLYWQAERQSVPRRAEQVPSGVCLDATPERDNRAPVIARSLHAPSRSHPRKPGPLLHVPARRRLWPQPPWAGTVLARGYGLDACLVRDPANPIVPGCQDRDSAACVSLC